MAMMMFLDDRDAEGCKGLSLPWNTPPSNQGSTECRWCWRFIYAPAVPCAIEVIAGLAEMATSSGLGDRCKWEVATRSGANGTTAVSPQ
jgi:hypothetical protein